jgi:hypothetical protein
MSKGLFKATNRMRLSYNDKVMNEKDAKIDAVLSSGTKMTIAYKDLGA